MYAYLYKRFAHQKVGTQRGHVSAARLGRWIGQWTAWIARTEVPAASAALPAHLPRPPLRRAPDAPPRPPLRPAAGSGRRARLAGRACPRRAGRISAPTGFSPALAPGGTAGGRVRRRRPDPRPFSFRPRLLLRPALFGEESRARAPRPPSSALKLGRPRAPWRLDGDSELRRPPCSLFPPPSSSLWSAAPPGPASLPRPGRTSSPTSATGRRAREDGHSGMPRGRRAARRPKRPPERPGHGVDRRRRRPDASKTWSSSSSTEQQRSSSSWLRFILAAVVGSTQCFHDLLVQHVLRISFCFSATVSSTNFMHHV